MCVVVVAGRCMHVCEENVFLREAPSRFVVFVVVCVLLSSPGDACMCVRRMFFCGKLQVDLWFLSLHVCCCRRRAMHACVACVLLSSPGDACMCVRGMCVCWRDLGVC